MSERITALVQHYRRIAAEKMQGLPIVNPALDVEAVGFTSIDGHETGVLITPWFMNLVVLPASEDYDAMPVGTAVEWSLPSGRYDMRLCRDELPGTYLTAVLFRSVTEFPGQAVAREVAGEIAAALERPPEASRGGRGLSRRELFTRLGAS